VLFLVGFFFDKNKAHPFIKEKKMSQAHRPPLEHAPRSLDMLGIARLFFVGHFVFVGLFFSLIFFLSIIPSFSVFFLNFIIQY
jgi:hypothetical protein